MSLSKLEKVIGSLCFCFPFFFQVLGFVVGPALQTAVSPLGETGTSLMGLPMNMYTAAGWINVLLGILNFALFLPWSFKEHKIAAREAMRDQGKASGNLDHLFI